MEDIAVTVGTTETGPRDMKEDTSSRSLASGVAEPTVTVASCTLWIEHLRDYTTILAGRRILYVLRGIDRAVTIGFGDFIIWPDR